MEQPEGTNPRSGQGTIAPADAEAFIRGQTRVNAVPLVPDIRLHLADEAVELWQKTEEDLGRIGLPPPFWAFAWAGGQALARYIGDHPNVMMGRKVLDFASGSGLVGIAAARAGATPVCCAEIDPFALAAIRLNAALNGVVLQVEGRDLVGIDEGWDVVLAGDIFYERETAARVEPWLRRLSDRGATVLIGDPGRSYLPRERLVSLAAYEVPVTRALEDTEIKRSQVWRLAQDGEFR